jgi:transposase
MTISVLGIDLAKRIFQLHGVDDKGKKVLGKALSRARLVDEVVRHGPKLIAFEAGAGAHHWGRRFQALGFEVMMIAPQYVRPFRRGPSKDDVADAAAIVEAASRASMPKVAVKQLWQQDLQAMHRIRQDLVERRTALCNQYRSHLVEFGIAPAQGLAPLVSAAREVLATDDGAVPPMVRRWLARFLEQLAALEGEIELATGELERAAEQSDVCRRLMAIPGFGPLSATGFLAAVGDGAFLKNGRQAAAWLGLSPRHVGSGGRSRNVGMTKRGHVYLRNLLIHGGRSVLIAAGKRPECARGSVLRLREGKPTSVAAVAIASRNARIAWRLIAKGEDYDAKRAG